MEKLNKAKLIDRRQIGRLWILRFACAPVAQSALPGQFVHIQVPNSNGFDPLLRRPFSILDTNPTDGTFDLLIQLKGKGTQSIVNVTEKTVVDVMGPLGVGFDFEKILLPDIYSFSSNLDSQKTDENKLKTEYLRKEYILIAGGAGLAPLFFAGKKLAMFKNDVVSVIGFWGLKTPETYWDFKSDLEESGIEWITAAESGKGCHFTGTVTDAASAWIREQNKDLNKFHVLTCGPVPMLKAVLAIAIPSSTQVSMEERMACGYGVCMGCAIPVKAENGLEYKRVCKDGPVFFADQVDWKRLP